MYKDLTRFTDNRPYALTKEYDYTGMVNGFDTETLPQQSKGYTYLLSDSNGNFLYDLNLSFMDILKFLFNKRYHSKLNVFYNINYDFNAILKNYIRDFKRDKDYLKNVIRTGYLKVNDYEIKFIIDKYFKISKGHKSVYFYDMANFFRVIKGSLNKNCKYFLNENKIDIDIGIMKSKKMIEQNKELLIKYCIHDSYLTAQLGEFFISQIYKIGIYPKKFISYGNLAGQLLLKEFGDRLPKVYRHKYYHEKKKEYPGYQDFLDYCNESYYGGRFEITKLGFCGQLYEIDINSAYPYAMTQLPDIAYSPMNYIKGDYKPHGIVKVKINEYPNHNIQGIPIKDSIVYFPKRNDTVYLHSHEIEPLEKFGYEFDILNCRYYTPMSNKKPFKKFVENIYSERKKLKENKDPLHIFYKYLLNSCYGKFLNVTKKSRKLEKSEMSYEDYVNAIESGNRDLSYYRYDNGDYDIFITDKEIGNPVFNLYIGSFITSLTRTKLIDYVIANKLQDRVYAFHTDSILTDKELKPNDYNLGEFNFELTGDTYIFKTGIYSIGDKVKARGMSKNFNFRNKELWDNDTIELEMKKVLRLKECIIQNKLELTDINKFTSIKKLFRIGDKKRVWSDLPRNYNEFTSNQYNSKPRYLQ